MSADRVAAKNPETNRLLTIRRTLYTRSGLRRIVPPDQLLLPAPTTPPRLAPGEEVPDIFTDPAEVQKEQKEESVKEEFEEEVEEEEVQEDSDTEPPSPVVEPIPSRASRLLKPKAEVRKPQPKPAPRDAREGFFALRLKQEENSP